MKIKNEYVKIKQGKNEVELHNLILDKYLSLFASSVLETKYKGLDSCLINCTIQEEITPSMDAMHWDFYLNEQNLYNNSDYKGASKIITKYLYEPNFKEQIQSFIGQKILSIGFAQMVEEPTLPDGSDATFELYAILDVSNYNLYVQDSIEFVVERVDTVTTDMVFSSDTEKFPIHLSPRGNSYFDQQEETGTREVGILNAIGKGYNSMFPTALMPKSNFNITRNENEIDITGLSIQENTGEELYPSNELYPKKKWSEEIQKSEKGSEVIIEGNDKEAFVDIEGKSVQNGTPSPSNPSEIHSVADSGTVTIKQEAVKNYLNWDKFIDYTNWTNSNSPGYKSFEITGLNINKTYTLCRTDTAGYGETSKYAGFNKGNNNGNMFLHSTDSSRNLQSVSDTPSEDGKIYITMYMSSQSDLNDYINIIKKCWVIEGTEYQEYVNNNYTIQTEPLRSLPNGVKDTIEEDGIHRRIRVLNLPIADMNNTEDYPGWNNLPELVAQFPNQNELLKNVTNFMCNIVQNNNPSIGINTKGKGTLYLLKGIFGLTQSQWKEQYPNLVVKIQYQLSEEIIEPFTEEQMEVLRSIQTFEGYNNFTTTDDLQPVIQVTEYENCIYPRIAQMNWIFYQYGIYKFIDAVTGYEYTGRLYREAKNTNKSGNLSLKIKYERGE